MQNNKSESKIIFIAGAPSPNTIEIYNNLYWKRGLDLEVWYCAETNDKWKNSMPKLNHPHFFFTNIKFDFLDIKWSFNPRILLKLLFDKCGLVVIQGYSSITLFIALNIIVLKRMSFAFWGERIKTSKKDKIILKLIKKYILYIVKKAARVYAIGNKAKESYANQGVKYDKIVNMPYSKDLKLYRSTYKHRYNACGSNIIVTTARLIRCKNIDVLINAFSYLLYRYPDWKLIILGSGPYEYELKKGVPEIALKNILWYGYAGIDLQCEVYKYADIFVLPSKEDGWGMVVLEAMAAGLPVISTEGVISSWDIIEDGVNGYRIKIDRIDELIFRLDSLILSSLKRQRMGQMSYAKAKLLDISRVSKQFELDLRNLLTLPSK